MFSVTACIVFFFFCTNNAATKSIVLSCIIFLYEILKNCSINLSKNVRVSFSTCFVFCYYLMIISNNVPYLYSLLKHIQYKYASASDFKRYFFALYHIISFPIYVLSRLYFISWSSPPPLLFNWPRTQLCLKFPNHIYVLMWSIIHCVNLRKFFFTDLRHFLTFLFFVFIEK